MWCPLNKYKNILGEQKKGIHKYRFMNAAIADIILTVILACLITYFSEVPLVLSIIGTFTAGLFLHIIFGVNTNAVQYLNVSCQNAK